MQILLKVFRKIDDQPEIAEDSVSFEPNAGRTTGHGVHPCVHVRVGLGRENWPTLALTSPERSLFKLAEGEEIEVWFNGKQMRIPKGDKENCRKLQGSDEVMVVLKKAGSVRSYRYKVHAIALR